MFKFNKEINSWNDWADVVYDIKNWEALVRQIFVNEKLSVNEIKILPVGTNAIFKVDDKVIKIFVPDYDNQNEAKVNFEAEHNALIRASQAHVPTSKVLKHGKISDKYLFYYLIMEYIEGKPVVDVYSDLTSTQKEQLVAFIKSSLSKINIPVKYKAEYEKQIKQRVYNNERWQSYNEQLRKEIFDHVESLLLTNFVYVHGDLTGENVLVKNDGSYVVIDMGDAQIAPAEYEYLPLAFDLFQYDKVLFLKAIPKDTKITSDILLNTLLIHDFGANILKEFYDNIVNKDIKEINSLTEIKAEFEKWLKK